MKRRNFVKNVAFASVGAPFVLKGMQYQGIAKKLFETSKAAEDRVLVIIRLNGGNDGLNTLIPLDGYDNLAIQRSNVLIPQNQLLTLNATNAFHPVMTGMKNLYQSGKLGIIQNVGYPEQNRSHFRSTDIWSTGILNDPTESRGWLGRHFDSYNPNFPTGYPNTTYPDPFAISMGSEVSETCQGIVANYSMAVNDPNTAYNLAGSNQTDDGTYYGAHMVYIANLIDQTNAYGLNISNAANAGNSLSTLYDPNNETAMQLKNVAKLISGGLKSKVYVLNINGFDTHNAQVGLSPEVGIHADLLKQLSDAIYAFQDDLNLLGLEHRVAGMTFSEFGRQIASNASLGTDHGDAAPMFLFGSCVNTGFLGANPVIGNTIQNQAGIPMQIDFRDIYASILKDWFEVNESDIQPLFEHTVTYYNIMNSCNLDVKENQKDQLMEALLFPNPASSYTTLQFKSDNEWTRVAIYDMQGKELQVILDKTIEPGVHQLKMEISNLTVGTYLVQISKKSGTEKVNLVKVR